jgi:hypothetical protein
VADKPVKLAPCTGDLGQGGAAHFGVLVFLPGQRLQQDVFLRGEVVHHLTGTHAGALGYSGQSNPVDACFGDQVQGGSEDAVAAALPVFRAGRPATARRWRGYSCCGLSHGRYAPAPWSSDGVTRASLASISLEYFSRLIL